MPLDDTMLLVINRQNGNQTLIAAQVVEALKTCTTFRTLDGHADALARQRPELQGRRDLALQALQQLRDADMLLSAATVRARLADSGPARLAPTRVFIITCDRPAAVERLLESMLRVGTLARHDALFLVDDSRGADNRRANREAVERFNLRSAKDMRYVGAEEQAALLDRLLRALPQHEAGIRFLVDPAAWSGKHTYGRSRTVCLLLSVGYRAIVMDDDVLCEAVLPPVREDGISFRGMRQGDFFPSREALMARRQPAAEDPLSGHRACLGQRLGAAIPTLNGAPLEEAQLADCNAAMLNVLAADSPILVTQCGSWGDPGMPGGHWVAGLDEASIERLVNAPHGMSAAIENRSNWVGCPQPTIHKMAFMSQVTGVDNSHLLPPYFPAFRGEDLLFGTMIEAMYHHGAVLEYAWAVPHLPVDERRGGSLREPMTGEGGIALFSRYMTEHIDYKDASNPQRRLRIIAEDARRMAARTDADLILDYRREQAKAQAQQLARLRAQLARAQELPSANWQGYLKRGVQEVTASLQERHSPTAIAGVPADTGEAALLGAFRELAEGWAAGLEAWEAVREVCRDGDSVATA